MVTLNGAQSTVLDELEREKQRYDSTLADFEAQVTAKREARKTRLRELVQAAKAQGIPDRRIYLALGFKQAGPFINFIRPPMNAITITDIIESIEKGETPSLDIGEYEPTFAPDTDMPGHYIVTDTHGEQIKGTFRAMGQQGSETILLEGWDEKWAHGKHNDGPTLDAAFENYIRKQYPEVTTVDWK